MRLSLTGGQVDCSTSAQYRIEEEKMPGTEEEEVSHSQSTGGMGISQSVRVT